VRKVLISLILLILLRGRFGSYIIM
jgi:hypothetical protein